MAEKKENCCKIQMVILTMGLEQEDSQTVLRAAGETETKQQNIQDWFELNEGDPGFQLLAEEEIAADVFKDSAMEE
jgi:hypothetical protein